MLDIALSTFFLVLMGFLYLNTYQIPGASKWDILGSRFFPQLVVGCAAVFSVIILVNSIRAYKRQQKKSAASHPFWDRYAEVVVTFLAMFLFLVTLDYLGFFLGGFLLLFFLQWYLANRRLDIYTFLVPGISVASIYYIFSKFLNVLFPLGLWGD